MKLSKNFTLSELLESPTARRMNYSEQFTPPQHIIDNLKSLCNEVLQPLRDKINKPITVTSGYRCPRLNSRIKGARNSQHLYGEAADIQVSGMTSEEVTKTIIDMNLPFDQVIEEFGAWVHVSHSQTPFNRREKLRAVKINGRTKYVPFKNN